MTDESSSQTVIPRSKVRQAEVSGEEAGLRLDKYLSKALPQVPLAHVFRLILKGEVRVNGKRAAGSRLALTNGLMTLKGVDGAVEDIYLRLKFSKNIADIKQLSFRIKDSDVSLSGALKNWTTKPVIAVKIESAQMDLDLLIPKGHRSPNREFLETLASTSQVSATATIEKGLYK